MTASGWKLWLDAVRCSKSLSPILTRAVVVCQFMNQPIHFPLTTAPQRRLLFETWEATGDVALACRTAHVGRRTFYAWKPRFLAGGYAALEHFASRAPKTTRRTPVA